MMRRLRVRRRIASRPLRPSLPPTTLFLTGSLRRRLTRRAFGPEVWGGISGHRVGLGLRSHNLTGHSVGFRRHRLGLRHCH